MFRSLVTIGPAPRRDREHFTERERRPARGTYRLRMAVSQKVRAQKFGMFVGRALREARDRGMTIPEIEQITGIGKSTLYRWREGDWTKDPRPSQVRAFCDGLEIAYSVAYRLLGWTENGIATAEPIESDPDLAAVARKLRDPNVSESEKQEIRIMLRMAARRRSGD